MERFRLFVGGLAAAVIGHWVALSLIVMAKEFWHSLGYAVGLLILQLIPFP